MDYNEDAINHNRPSASEAQKRSGVSAEHQRQWKDSVAVTMESFQRSQAEWLAARQLALLRPVEAIPLPPLRPLPTTLSVEPVMSVVGFAQRLATRRSAMPVEGQRQVAVTMESFKRFQAEWLAAQQLTLLQPVEARSSPALQPLSTSEFAHPVMDIEEFSARVDALCMNRSVEKRQENVAEPAKPAELLESSQSGKQSGLSPERQRQLDELIQTARQKFDDNVLARVRPKPLEPLPPLPTWPEERMREIADLTQRLEDATRRRQEQNRAARAGAGPSGNSAVDREEQSPL